jgi:RNA polymerase primary sigma factor
MSKILYSGRDKNFYIYCKEIGGVPLLSKQEEIDLANQIRLGNSSVSGKARHKLILANLLLVVKIIKGYSNLGLESSDLISEGNIGLATAAEKFDPSKGARFSTYAAYWIKQSIRRALSNKSRTIRLPVHLTQLNYSIIKFTKDYERENSREPTNKEIAIALKVSVKKIEKVKSANTVNSFIFLDEKFNSEEDKDRLDVVEDCHTQSPAEAAMKNGDLSALYQEINSTLDEREKCIIQYRFGLKNFKCHTLEQLGEKFGITRERIRQIEQAALKKLHRKLEKKMS